MKAKLFHIYGPLYINSYGLFIAIGLLVFMQFAKRALMKKKLMDSEMFNHLFTLCIVATVLGGRALFIISQWDQFSSWTEWFELWNGGFSILGGIIGCLVTVTASLKYYKIPLLPTADIASVYVPLLESIARIGCFFAGCCYGQATTLPWGVTYTCSDSTAPLMVSLHPTQLYSSALLFIIFIIMHQWLQKKLTVPGQLVSVYLMLTCLQRFLVDFLRADQVFVSWQPTTIFSIHQIISGILFIGAGMFFLYRTSTNK